MIKQLLLIGAITVSSIAVAQSVPNGGFETWTNNGMYEEPTGWATFNVFSILGAPVSTTKSTASHSGMYAPRVETITADLDGDGNNDTIPGAIFNGAFDLFAGTQTIGSPFTERPDSLIGWYKYAPAGGDSFSVQVTLSKWNGTSQEIIAEGMFTESTAAAAYTRLSIGLDYNSTDTPDTMAIFVTSSTDQPVPGSAVWVDDLSFVTNSTAAVIAKASEAPIQLYPNPAKDVVNVVLAKDATIHIYNALGMEVDVLKGTAAKTVTIATSKYDNGVYLLKTDSGIVQRFVVKH